MTQLVAAAILLSYEVCEVYCDKVEAREVSDDANDEASVMMCIHKRH